MTRYLLAAMGVWNLVVLIVFGIDKRSAAREKWRISETFLLVISFCAGGVGAFIGMRLFRHRTRHAKFNLLVPIAALLTALLVWVLLDF